MSLNEIGKIERITNAKKKKKLPFLNAKLALEL